ncbi:hypothetical protein [Paramicrobacterium chengjingii]|uniref:Uncharacterized protein n=1 Tax=Paramicrobacterium chengjingii TaxID=2769067 RepID=A0ABX6YM18_9MICO|nr:hypothetical protein [Microbacterium chengjingii]QPZ39715.1 hypothetical protein HCR76_06630 [Microbacterium chengjingii]
MNGYPTPVPIEVVEIIDRFIEREHDAARKFTNREVLDESGAYSLHEAASSVYARAYHDGRMAERARTNGERQRARDTERANEETP